MCLRRLTIICRNSALQTPNSEMPYFYNTPDDIAAMLQAIGVGSIDELFSGVPNDLRLKRPLDIPPALSEMELAQHLEALAAKNSHIGQKACFLGGRAYDHFVPA